MVMMIKSCEVVDTYREFSSNFDLQLLGTLGVPSLFGNKTMREKYKKKTIVLLGNPK